MRRITKKQFDAFCYSRQPLIRIISEEVAWFEVLNRKLLAVIILDKTDQDFGFVILGRDARRIFRALDVRSSYETVAAAEDALKEHIKKFIDDGQDIYPQGDERETPNEIFSLCVEVDKIHPNFKILMEGSRFEAARNLIKEIVYSYIDPDGHYIKEFQTHGFDARLWELYLYVYLYDAGFEFIREHASPDYHISSYGNKCFIEAVTINSSQNLQRPDPVAPETPEQITELRQDYLPIKYGSALFSKLQKKYWELDHVKGHPLLIAVHDFHMPGSMTWSRAGLCDYLYGIRSTEIRDKEGKIKNEKIENHSWEGKIIPSGFFSQPDTENISAVLFSNAATISKFNRMGKLAGLGSSDVKLIRAGVLFNPDPNVFKPLDFYVDVDSPEYEESWSDSLIMFHNPNAKYPVNPDLFQDISHMMYDLEKEEFYGIFKPYDVLASITFVITSNGTNQSDLLES